MSKGLLAPGVLGVCALLLPVVFSSWRNRGYLLTLGAAALAALPWVTVWPALLQMRSPALFDQWFWVNNFGRFLGLNDLGPESAPGEYFVMMLWYAWPALPLAAWVLWQRGREALVTPQLQLPVLVFSVAFVILSLSADARELYAMPMLLPLALLAAASIDALKRSAANFLDWFGIMTFGVLALLLWAGYLALMTGTPERIADLIEEWFRDGAADGFNLMPPVLPGMLEIFIEQVVPLLQRRGLFRTEYKATTLRGHYGLNPPPTRWV
jgi:hypothetical protein